jgi:tRNA G18 (ribose-2'-O)-methylase SpoU
MLTVQSVQDLDLPELKPYRTLKYQDEHQKQGIFVVEGEKTLRRLLVTSIELVSLLLTEEWLEALRPELEKRPEHIHAFIAPRPLLETIVGFNFFQGLIAVARVPRLWKWDEVLAAAPSPKLLVALDGMSNPENLGVLIRNCAAFGVHGLLVGETCVFPWLRRAVRSSMGAVFHLPFARVYSLSRTLAALSAAGVRTIAAHPHTEAATLYDCDLRGDCCLVFGHEGNGVSPEVLAACERQVAIPMPPEVDSLNVSSSAAAFLFEANRQRRLAIP